MYSDPTHLTRPGVQSQYGSAGERPEKRRRIEFGEQRVSGTDQQGSQRADDDVRTIGGTHLNLKAMAHSIDMRLQFLGGERTLTPEVERPRFHLLRDACVKGDVFFLHLHSLFCQWSLHGAFPLPSQSYDLDAITRGFAILETVLKKNSCFTRPNLQWCAEFPYRDFNETCYDPGVRQVADFLTALSQHWPTLHQDSFNRFYPYLMDELLGKLRCYSSIVQEILFTASRRRLGITDGDLGIQAQRRFAEDQRQHRDEHGRFRLVVLSDPQDTECRNKALVEAYRSLVYQAKAQAQERQVQQQVQQQQQQQRQIQQQQQQQRQIQQQQQQQHQRQQQHQQQQYQHQELQLLQQQQQLRQHLQQQHQLQAAMRPDVLQQQGRFWQQHAVQAAQQTAQQFHQTLLHSQLPTPGQQSAYVNGRPSPVQAVFPPNPQWVQNQMPVAMIDARRASMNASPNVTAQFATRPQSSGAYSGVGSPSSASPRSAFGSHPAMLQRNQLPQQYTMAGSPTTPTTPGPTMARDFSNNLAALQQSVSNTQQQAPGGPGQISRQYAVAGLYPTQWPSNTPSPTFIPNPQMAMMQQMRASVSPQLGGAQQTWPPPQPTIQMHPQRVQPVPMARNKAARIPQPLLIPPPGRAIDRSDYPHTHQDKKSMLMSLHQSHARSPDRTRHNGDPGERHYQAVQSFAVDPFRLSQYHEVKIEVSPEQVARLCKQTTLPSPNGNQTLLSVREYTDGSLRFRVRCCRLPSEKQTAEPGWLTRDVLWPEHIFMTFNQQKSLPVRRSSHHGKDLPVEVTDFVVAGTNTLRIATSKGGPTAPDKKGNLFYLAVEIIETISHSRVLRNIEANGRVSRDETLKKIRSRVTAAPEEDGIAVIDRTGDTANELSIDLTDPFSAMIFVIPARGAACTHMECFDLETWLTTRPTKQQIKCGHKDVCTCPKRSEPSEPDKWKCPICFGDARPGSLRIDSFLEGVRKRLAELDKLGTKSILVAADGTWRPVEEPDDDDGSDGDGPSSRPGTAALRRVKGPSKSASVDRGPVEVIELD